MGVVQDNYLEIYTKRLSDGFERSIPFRDAIDLAEQNGCDFNKQISACTSSPDASFITFLRDLLSSGGDLAKIMPGPAGDLLKGLSSDRTKVKAILNTIKQLLPFYDPIENQNILALYFWRNTLPDSSPEQRASAFDQVVRTAGLKFNPSAWSDSEEAPEVSYNDDPAAKHRLQLLAGMIGIPDSACCTPKGKSMEAMINSCQEILRSGVDAPQQEKIDETEQQLKANTTKIDQSKWSNAKVQMSRGEALGAASKGVIAGLVAFGLIYTYNKLNKTSKA